jgi:dCMP deaminase
MITDVDRISRYEWAMAMARVTAKRGSCARRQVGCVLLNERYEVLATGYNGSPRGFPHCTDFPCAGAYAKSGEGLDLCEAIHAEQNALLQCEDVNAIRYCFCTAEPCIHCVKLILNTGCERVIFDEPYPGNAKKLWERTHKAGTWQLMSDTKMT